jgi:hypothetical protein
MELKKFKFQNHTKELDRMMNKKFIKIIVAVLLTAISVIQPTPVSANKIPSESISAWKEVKFKMGPGIDYWTKVAQCETNNNWQTNSVGGLNISLSAWQGYGGEEFASHPSKASIIEQIVVANRIAVFGYQTQDVFMTHSHLTNNRDFHRPPLGFNKWNCIKYTIKAPDNVTYTVSLPKSKKFYCPKFESMFEQYALPSKVFSYIAWRESRCNPKAINAIWKNGQIVWTLNKNGSYDSGLLQINSSWHKTVKQNLGYTPQDLMNPEVNVLFASWLLHYSSGRLSNWNIKASK